MKIKTTFSIYDIVVNPDRGMIHTTKVETLSPSSYNKVGETCLNTTMGKPVVGDRCYFDGGPEGSWSTSIVMEILED